MVNYIMYRSTTSNVSIRDIAERLYNRYTVLILLLVVMLFVHASLIQIHPLMFIVWPASAWLTIEIYSRWKEEPIRVFMFTATFTLYLVATQLLVVENTKGIFFDLDLFPNMATISYYVLGVSAMLFFYDAFVAKTISFRNIPVYVGFASVIPWGSPLLVEALILVRWVIDGSFALRTAGKGLGAASINDILFIYGSRNLAYSITLFYTTMALLRLSELLTVRREGERDKKYLLEQDRAWLAHAWENPLTLLNPDERSSFLEEHNHLAVEKRNEILREKVLPEKGIRLTNPKASSGWNWRGKH